MKRYVGITGVKEAGGSAQRQAVEPEHAGTETAFGLCAGLEAKAQRKSAAFRPAHRRNLTHSACVWHTLVLPTPTCEAFWERKPALSAERVGRCSLREAQNASQVMALVT